MGIVCNRKKTKLVCGIGVNDSTEIVMNGKTMIDSYAFWIGMIYRCNSEKKLAQRSNYRDVSICSEWLYFTNFKEWFDENYIEDYELDKDIILKGNRIYCPEYCRFIPKRLNGLVINNTSTRGSLPIGVTYRSRQKSKPYVARITKESNRIHIGYYETPELAFEAYRNARLGYIKEIALESFLNNEIKSDVASALINWNIEITD